MKNLVKLFAAGLVILASNSFAQSPPANDQKLASTSNPLISGAENESNIQELKDEPNISSRRAEHRRELRAQGLKGKEFRRAYRERMHAHKVAVHEQRLARRANHSDQVNDNHQDRRHKAAQMEQRDVTRREVHQNNNEVKSRRKAQRH